MPGFKRFSFLLSIITIFTLLSLGSCYKYAVTIPVAKKYHKTLLEIKRGESSSSIAFKLKQNKIIHSIFVFKLYLKLHNLETRLRAGTFSLSPSYNLKKIAKTLQEKEDPSGLIKITIPEGFEIKQIADLLESRQLVKASAFLNYATEKAPVIFKQEFDFIAKIPTNNLEGYLFPDTYLFSKTTTIETIFRTMLKQTQNQLYLLWQSASKKQKTTQLTFHQALTLASIIEKETYLPAEMGLISAVFHNRLKQRIVLASCPTVLYAIGDPEKEYLFYKDLEIKSVYNTYRRQGLPPTPIASPGLKAFKATLNPEKTKYLYFIANGDGSHHFSYNMQEHLQQQNIIARRKRRYR